MNFTPLKAFLNSYLPMLGIPGSDTVIYKEHELIFRHTTGFDSLERKTPLTADKLYNVYSCSKIATGIAATQLIERGEILATDPVYAYFPEFKNVRVAVRDSTGKIVDTRPAKTTMLIKHLLTMTSGINYDLKSKSITGVQESTYGRAPTAKVCAAIASEPLEFDPGENFLYGLSLDIMAGIVELVSGMRFADYMAENLFLPLGMKDTSYHIDETKSSRFATQYVYDTDTGRGREIPFENNDFRFGTEYDSGGAGVISTVDDYALLMDALANGGVGKTGNRILSERGVALLSSNGLSPEITRNFSVEPHFNGFGYGYGVRCMLDPAEAGSLAPRGYFGWDGLRLAIAFSDPVNKISMFHAEHMGGLHRVVIPRLRNLVYSCLDY